MKAFLSEGEYFGCRRAVRNAGTLILSECAYEPGYQIPKHEHENPYFIFTLDGSQEEVAGTCHRSYTAGTLAFHPAGETHREKVGSTGLRCLHVELKGTWLDRDDHVSRLLRDGAHMDHGRPRWLADRIYREFRCLDEVSPVVIEGLLLEVLGELSRYRHRVYPLGHPDWLAKAQALIHDRFTEPLTLCDVAAAVGIHPVHLARRFRAAFGCSVGEFIRRARIESACGLIRTGDMSLGDAGLAVGFADQAHFTRTFKRIMGMSPGQFRGVQSNGRRNLARTGQGVSNVQDGLLWPS